MRSVGKCRIVIIIIGAIKEDIQKDDLAREPTPREARSMPAFAREMRKVE